MAQEKTITPEKGVKVEQEKLDKAKLLYFDAYKRFPSNKELVDFAMEFFNEYFETIEEDQDNGKKK